jgi:Tfp pilus assembly protein PilE
MFSSYHGREAARAFTLIELLVVIAIPVFVSEFLEQISWNKYLKRLVYAKHTSDSANIRKRPA